MDWLSTLIKTTKDYLITNGVVLVIVIFVTASITTILGYIIPAFYLFMRHLPQRIGALVRMIKKWLYWRRYHPDYCFTAVSKAIISKYPSSAVDVLNNPSLVYQISIQMRLCIYNNDDLNTLFLNCAQGKMNLRLHSKKEKRARYILSFSSSYTDYKVIPLKERTIDFGLSLGFIDIIPKIGDEPHCDKINIGIAQLNGMNYNLKGKPFNVKVDWSKITGTEGSK